MLHSERSHPSDRRGRGVRAPSPTLCIVGSQRKCKRCERCPHKAYPPPGGTLNVAVMCSSALVRAEANRRSTALMLRSALERGDCPVAAGLWGEDCSLVMEGFMLNQASTSVKLN